MPNLESRNGSMTNATGKKACLINRGLWLVGNLKGKCEETEKDWILKMQNPPFSLPSPLIMLCFGEPPGQVQ